MNINETLIIWILLIIAAYLLGAIPFGLIFAKFKNKNIDIRKSGSGNIGATNVLRTFGLIWGILTLIADGLKGAIPTWIALQYSHHLGSEHIGYILMVALATVIGHLYPCYLKFRNGGKGVATTAGCILILAPIVLLYSFILFSIIVISFRKVSLASLIAITSLPFIFWHLNLNQTYIYFGIIILLLIMYRHKANINRILNGTEPSIF